MGRGFNMYPHQRSFCILGFLALRRGSICLVHISVNGEGSSLVQHEIY
jgi:hypothetical protein